MKIYQTLTNETSLAIILNMQWIFQWGIWVLKPWQPDFCFILVFGLTKTANSNKNLKRRVYLTKTTNSDKKILKDVSMKRATFFAKKLLILQANADIRKIKKVAVKICIFSETRYESLQIGKFQVQTRSKI